MNARGSGAVTLSGRGEGGSCPVWGGRVLSGVGSPPSGPPLRSGRRALPHRPPAVLPGVTPPAYLSRAFGRPVCGRPGAVTMRARYGLLALGPSSGRVGAVGAG
jgi:hypothetical protein